MKRGVILANEKSTFYAAFIVFAKAIFYLIALVIAEVIVYVTLTKVKGRVVGWINGDSSVLYWSSMIVFDLWSTRQVVWIVFDSWEKTIVFIAALWYFSVVSISGDVMRADSVGWFFTIKSEIFLNSLDSLIVATLVVTILLFPVNSWTTVSVNTACCVDTTLATSTTVATCVAGL